MNLNKQIESYAKTTKETSAQRIQEITGVISYGCGVPQAGAQVIAQLITTLEVRITELEARLTVAEWGTKNTNADPPRTRR